MNKVLIITSSLPKFRRAGENFTDTGAAFPAGYFDTERLKALRHERKLSVQEMARDEVPDYVDISRLEAAEASMAKLSLEYAPEPETEPEPEPEPEQEPTPRPAAKTATKKPAAKSGGDQG